MILVNGKPDNRIDISDRGLQYGDGLFETIAYRDGKLEFLQSHLTRLYAGCERLNIPYQQLDSQLTTELELLCRDLSSNAVIKIIITRGHGGRGYRITPDIIPTRIISTHPYPSYPESCSHGITVRICEHLLSENKQTAGIKHLNRLDQVLARSEWNDEKIAEGLMFNNQQQLIEGTMSNLFLVQQDKLLTPKLSLSGVAGIMRQQVICCAQRENIEVIETVLTQQDLVSADEAFITNSLIDIWPILEVENLAQYKYGTMTKQLQTSLSQLAR